jgi:uncharacterized protein
MERIQKVYDLVEMECKKETNYFGYGIWSHHILSVVKYAKLLANKLNADVEVVELAALLHDYASIKNKDFYEDHHIYSAKFAEEILTEMNYSLDIIEKIKQCIFNHRGSELGKKNSPEEKIIADADALAHFDNIGSLFYLAFFRHKKDIDEAESWLMKKLKRSWNKISLEESKKLIKPKYDAAMLLLD